MATSRPRAARNSGSQSYVPPDEKDDRALKEALDLLRGTITNAAFPPILFAKRGSSTGRYRFLGHEFQTSPVRPQVRPWRNKVPYQTPVRPHVCGLYDRIG